MKNQSGANKWQPAVVFIALFQPLETTIKKIELNSENSKMLLTDYDKLMFGSKEAANITMKSLLQC